MNWITNIGLNERLSCIYHVSKYKDVLFGYISTRLMSINISVKESFKTNTRQGTAV